MWLCRDHKICAVYIWATGTTSFRSRETSRVESETAASALAALCAHHITWREWSFQVPLTAIAFPPPDGKGMIYKRAYEDARESRMQTTCFSGFDHSPVHFQDLSGRAGPDNQVVWSSITSSERLDMTGGQARNVV